MRWSSLWLLGLVAFYVVSEVLSWNEPVQSSAGLHVRCRPTSMDLIVDRWVFHYLDPMTFHFNGTNCKPTYVNTTHVIMRTPLGGCNTRYIANEDLITFSNVVDTEVFGSGRGISRYPAHLFIFECSYYTTFKMTLNAFSTEGKIVTRPKVQMGNFSFTMNMFQTSKYFSPYSSFPVRVRVGERVYLQVKVVTNASGLTLFLDRCKATPSKDPNSDLSYYVLRNGCPTDETLNYKASIDTKQRFSFQAFRFQSAQQTKDVYLHCEVIVCHEQNNASRCRRACEQKPRYLTKREITTRELEPEYILDDNLTSVINLTTKVYDVMLGPMKVYIDAVRGPPRLREVVDSGKRSRGQHNSLDPVLLVLTCLVLLYKGIFNS